MRSDIYTGLMNFDLFYSEHHDADVRSFQSIHTNSCQFIINLKMNKYGVFADESSHTDSRFRSIASLSLPAEIVPNVQDELSLLLSASDAKEFKWQKLRSAKYRFCAKKIVDYLISQLIPQKARIDVLIWDTKDKRHDIMGRDDIQNFERMFFHLHKNLMSRRENEAEWHIRPDERSDIDWKDTKTCLSNVGNWRDSFSHPLFNEIFTKHFYSVKSFKEVDSIEYPLCQVADLFAGLGAYCRKESKLVKSMLSYEYNKNSFFPDNTKPDLSGADDERFKVIKYLYRKSREKRFGLSLKTHGYFVTRDPSKPINFWHYQPQHYKDKAPVRDDD